MDPKSPGLPRLVYRCTGGGGHMAKKREEKKKEEEEEEKKDWTKYFLQILL